jgi:hypothetical protein
MFQGESGTALRNIRDQAREMTFRLFFPLLHGMGCDGIQGTLGLGLIFTWRLRVF